MRALSLEENLHLKRTILTRIRHRGRIPFSEFMELCLYHPVYGYYQTGKEKIGKRGDYFTSPCVHPVFGRLVARQLEEMGNLLGEGTFWVVEAGAGRGILAADILEFLVAASPGFFERLRYGIVERGAIFTEEQKRRLAPYEGKVHWLGIEKIHEGALQGCLVANEFIDALPVHRVVVQGGELREVYVTERKGVFHEVAGPPSTGEILRYFDEIGVQLEEGQHAEVNLEALAWYEEVSRILNRGFLLIIDYGYLADELYTPDRRSGTLLCYFRHTWSDDPYRHIGLQDMTAHVNFTSLVQKGQSLGFALTGLVPQYRFLLSLGFLEEVERLGERDLPPEHSLLERLTMKHLILPEGGMGDTFKVLIQHKGVKRPRLRGLQDL